MQFMIKDLTPHQLKRKQMAVNYYKKLIPTVYFDWLGIFGFIKYIVFQVIGLFKPIYRQSV